MKKLIFISFASVIVTLINLSCAKTETPVPTTDVRDKYVGNWNGTFSDLDFTPTSTSVKVDIKLAIKKGDGDNKLTITINPDNNQTIMNATVSQGTFDDPGEKVIYDPFLFNGKSYRSNGNFKIESENADFATSRFMYDMPNSTVTGTSSGIFTKQK